MDKKIRTLRQKLSRLPRNARGYRRVSLEIRIEVLELAAAWRADGGKAEEFCRRLGLSKHTLSGWKQRDQPPPKRRGKTIRKVRIEDERPAPKVEDLSVALPSGLRIEGLSLWDAIACAKELG